MIPRLGWTWHSSLDKFIISRGSLSCPLVLWASCTVTSWTEEHVSSSSLSPQTQRQSFPSSSEAGGCLTRGDSLDCNKKQTCKQQIQRSRKGPEFCQGDSRTGHQVGDGGRVVGSCVSVGSVGQHKGRSKCSRMIWGRSQNPEVRILGKQQVLIHVEVRQPVGFSEEHSNVRPLKESLWHPV